MAQSGSYGAGGGFSYALTSPSESALGNINQPTNPENPFRRSSTGSYVDPWAANQAMEQQRAREAALTGQLQNQQQAGVAQTNLLRAQGQKATGINQLMGFGSGGPGGQLANLLKMLGVGGADSMSLSAGGGGANPAGYQGLMGDINALLGQTGNARRQDINRGVDTTVNSSLARLSDRGLGSSSLTANTAMGGERVRQGELTRLEDMLTGQRASAMQNIGLQGLEAQQQQYQLNQQLAGQRSQQGLGFLSNLLG